MIESLLLASLLLVPAPQAKPATPPAPQTEAQKAEEARRRELEVKLQLLDQRYQAAEREWTDQMRQNSADLEARKALAAKHPVKEFWKPYEDLAKEGEARALLWLAQHAEKGFEDPAEIARRKLALFHELIDQHASDPWGMDIAIALSLQRHWLETQGVEDLLNDFAGKTKNREFAAAALSRIASILSGVTSSNSADQKKVDDLRARILRDYPETEAAKRLGGAAAPKKEVSLLSGAPAPDFSGKDVDGKDLGLAEFRGKVLLVEFWGFWSPACRATLPHLRELLEKHAQDPFAILGVAADDDAARFRDLSKEHKVGWRSIWEGGRTGAVTRLYRVNAFPTLYLIDAQGVIRKAWFTQPADKDLDEEIAAAIAAAKRAPK